MNDKYLKYDAIDLAAEDSFIDWVQRGDRQASDFWEKWISEHPSKKETVRQATQIVKAITIEEKEPSTAQIDQLWNRIGQSIEKETVTPPVLEKKTPVRTIGRRTWLSLAVAASVAVLWFFVFYNPVQRVGVSAGMQRLSYQLPDGSTVDLNAASEISFSKKNFTKNRTVNLQGEAFFEVEKGSPFKVVTRTGTVEVLGTSFNVETREDVFAVDCKTGKVQVTAGNSQELLTAGMGTQWNNQTSQLAPAKNINVEERTGWRTGQFYFNNVPFEKVIEALERQYNVTIECEEELKQQTGNYLFSGDLEEAIKNVSYPLNAQVTINGSRVVIQKK